MKKNNSGITLIALIITIIVMLILVAVTINLTVNGGLFGYASNAASETKTEKEKEENWTNIADNMTTDQLIAKYTTDSEADLAKLRAYFVGKKYDDVYDYMEEHYINNDILSDAENIQLLDDGGFIGEYLCEVIEYNGIKYIIYEIYDEIGDQVFEDIQLFRAKPVTDLTFIPSSGSPSYDENLDKIVVHTIGQGFGFWLRNFSNEFEIEDMDVITPDQNQTVLSVTYDEQMNSYFVSCLQFGETVLRFVSLSTGDYKDVTVRVVY